MTAVCQVPVKIMGEVPLLEGGNPDSRLTLLDCYKATLYHVASWSIQVRIWPQQSDQPMTATDNKTMSIAELLNINQSINQSTNDKYIVNNKFNELKKCLVWFNYSFHIQRF